MARLNELPVSVSTESFETLRRKFLRQNRDIARVNSAQSLRIRSLESECSRLLSENLTLNARIVELGEELDECRGAQRIADHALEIKAKMEAQLAEFGAMIQGLGIEPAAKRRATVSPGGTRRIARVRGSGSSDRSPSARQRPRDSRSADELTAIQHEGRLPPIHEEKMFQRRVTMSHDELRAVCDGATDADESPDLGPPPTSRFVEEDPVKIDSPSRSTGSLQPSPKIIKGEALPRPDALPQLKLEPKKRTMPVQQIVSTEEEDTAPAVVSMEPSIPIALKAGSKRKYGDENDQVQASKAFADKDAIRAKTAVEKPLVSKDANNRRTMKDLARKGHSAESVSGKPRKALAEKSTNDDMVSPKKQPLKSTATDDLKKSDRPVAPLKKKRVVPIKVHIPHLPAPSVEKLPQEPATPSADPAGLVFPDTPETKSAVQNPADTPPPADISVHGETSRPSRRVRAAISYAEPNLRDKMRRPSKQLLDAVAGEGKYRRTSSVQPVGQLSSTTVMSEGKQVIAPEALGQPQNAEAAIAHEAARRPHVTSPLQQKAVQEEQSHTDLPDSVATERRRRPSSRQSQLFELQVQAAEEEEIGVGVDPYEFQSTSPATDQPKEAASRGRITKGMKRAMAANNGQGDAGEATSRPHRKRASMAASKKSLLDDDSSYNDDSGEFARPESSTKERISRRRSMMV